MSQRDEKVRREFDAAREMVQRDVEELARVARAAPPGSIKRLQAIKLQTLQALRLALIREVTQSQHLPDEGEATEIQGAILGTAVDAFLFVLHETAMNILANGNNLVPGAPETMDLQTKALEVVRVCVEEGLERTAGLAANPRLLLRRVALSEESD